MDDTYHRHNTFPRQQPLAGYEAADPGYRNVWPAKAQADGYAVDAYGVQRQQARLPQALPQAAPQAGSHRREPTPPRAHPAATGPSYGGAEMTRGASFSRAWQPEPAPAPTDPRSLYQQQPRQQPRQQPDSNFYLLDPSTIRAPTAAELPVTRGYGERPVESRQRSPLRPRGGAEPAESYMSGAVANTMPAVGQRLSAPPSATPAVTPAAPSKAPCCDRCDGPHETDRCPHFRGKRDEHPDAWSSYTAVGAAKDSARPAHLPPLRECVAPRQLQRSQARVVGMPGDGSCLFHSLAHGLRAVGYRESGHDVRLRIARFILEHGSQCEISGTPLSSWVEWESRSSVSDYVARLQNEGLWGGAIEMAAATQIYSVDVGVYEEDGRSGNLMRISDFLSRESPRAAVLVVYKGRSHYDAIDLAAPTVAREPSQQYAGYGDAQYGQVPQQRYAAGGTAAYGAQYGTYPPYGAQPYASRPEEEDESWECAVM